MTGILLLAHGSREGDTEVTMHQVTAYVKDILQNDMVEEAYLQFRCKTWKTACCVSLNAAPARSL
jgi:sirohydrochlorin ferrochelatase